MDVAARSASWLGEIVELMREPAAVLPVAGLLARLRQHFRVPMASWNWFDADGTFGAVVDPAEVMRDEPDLFRAWRSGELFAAHPLLQWYRRTGGSQPMTMARVPTRLVSRRRRLPLERALAAIEQEHQLSMTYRSDGRTHRAFLLARGLRDFSSDDLEVAETVRRSLVAFDHQVAVVQRISGLRAGADLGLTGRQLAVLRLFAEGATTRRASRALGCSPRTVEKHLENAFRRLGVKDRLSAVRVLWTAGVFGPAPVPDHAAVVARGAYRGGLWLP